MITTRFYCWPHRTLTLFAACRECLRERTLRSLAQRREEVAALREKADSLRRARETERTG